VIVGPGKRTPVGGNDLLHNAEVVVQHLQRFGALRVSSIKNRFIEDEVRRQRSGIYLVGVDFVESRVAGTDQVHGTAQEYEIKYLFHLYKIRLEVLAVRW